MMYTYDWRTHTTRSPDSGTWNNKPRKLVPSDISNDCNKSHYGPVSKNRDVLSNRNGCNTTRCRWWLATLEVTKPR